MGKWIFRGFIAVLLLLGISIILLWTPDTKREEMIAKYGGSQALWTKSASGQDIHYRDQGPKDAPALILIHGSNASLHTWDDWVARLQSDYRVIRMDLPGHGISGPHPQADYSASAMIDAVASVANAADVERFTIVGNSMGGWVSWRFALTQPERISHLVLIDSSGPPPPDASKRKLPIGYRLAQIPVLNRLFAKLMSRSLIESSFKKNVVDPSLATKERVDRYWELLRFPGNRQALLNRFATDREISYVQQLPTLSMPTLLLWGREDTIVPIGIGEVFDREIPNSQLIVYENIGHLPMIENSAQSVQDLRKFLESNP